MRATTTNDNRRAYLAFQWHRGIVLTASEEKELGCSDYWERRSLSEQYRKMAWPNAVTHFVPESRR